VSDVSHWKQEDGAAHPAALAAAGLVPPPALDWEAWRRHVDTIRKQRGLSINKLTERSGLDRSTVIELLGGRRGVHGIRIESAWALAWALEVRPEEFASFLAPLVSAE